jgi:hypothetical protein
MKNILLQALTVYMFKMSLYITYVRLYENILNT